MSAVFFGTPQLAATVLEGLISSNVVKISAVVTQQDKPSGRGQKLQPSAVKQVATRVGLPVFQPKSLRKDAAELMTWLDSNERPSVFIVVAYGLIIPPSLIDYPTNGIINVHLSLLPRWRGAAPIQRAIMAGDAKSGVSIMKIDEGLDTGPVYSMRNIDIAPEDDTGSLTEKLAKLGTNELLQRLPEIISGSLKPTAQAADGVTYAEKISKEELAIDWRSEATQITLNVRGFSPAPGARTSWRNEPVKIYKARSTNSSEKSVLPGTVVAVGKHSITVQSGGGTAVEILEMQLPGKKRLAVAEILKSLKIEVGEKFE